MVVVDLPKFTGRVVGMGVEDFAAAEPAHLFFYLAVAGFEVVGGGLLCDTPYANIYHQICIEVGGCKLVFSGTERANPQRVDSKVGIIILTKFHKRFLWQADVLSVVHVCIAGGVDEFK